MVIKIIFKFLNFSRKCNCSEVSSNTEKKKQKCYTAMKKLCPFIVNKAIRNLIPFASDYFCAIALKVIKIYKYRSILNTEKDENRVFKMYATM